MYMALESSLESYHSVLISVVNSMHEEFVKRDWEAKWAGGYGEWASRKHHEVNSSQLLLIESHNFFF